MTFLELLASKGKKSIWVLCVEDDDYGRDPDNFHPVWNNGYICRGNGVHEWREYTYERSMRGILLHLGPQDWVNEKSVMRQWHVYDGDIYDSDMMTYFSVEKPTDSSFPIGKSYAESGPEKVKVCTCGACHIKDSSHSDWCDIY